MADNIVRWPGSPPPDSPSGDGAPTKRDWLAEILRDLSARTPEHLHRRLEDLGSALVTGEPLRNAAVSDSAERTAEIWEVAGLLREALVEAEVRQAGRASRSAPGPDRKREERRRCREELDRILLTEARAAIAMATDAQRRLLEDVSHDIRSPLNSILFLADALRAEQSGPLNDVQARQVDVLYTAAVTLVKMVNDLIDFARMGDRERIIVVRASFSVESVLADVTGLVGPLTAHRRVALRTEVATEGLRSGDPQLLSRVLLNLVSNAVQAVDEGGHVSVHVSEADSGDLRIEVTDDRIGTDTDKLRDLIRMFPDASVPGVTRGWTRGLGLSISARLVRAAGGRIDVSSLAGEGTVFSLELPFPRL